MGFTDKSKVVKSPTSEDEVPTFVLVPAVLILNSNLSGYSVVPTVGIRVQKETVEPFWIFTTGVIYQLLISPTPAVLLKLAPAYADGAPVCALKTAGFPWNQVAVPIGSEWLIIVQSSGKAVKPSVMVFTCAKDA